MQTLSALWDGLRAATSDVLNSTRRGQFLEVRKMKKILLQSSVFLLLLGLMSTSHSQGNENRYIPVFCNQGHSIQDAVDKATEGATIEVFGTCHEAVLVDKDRLKFFGLGEGSSQRLYLPVALRRFKLLLIVSKLKASPLREQ